MKQLAHLLAPHTFLLIVTAILSGCAPITETTLEDSRLEMQVTAVRTVVMRYRQDASQEIPESDAIDVQVNDRIEVGDQGRGRLRFQYSPLVDDLLVELLRNTEVTITDIHEAPATGSIFLRLMQAYGTVRVASLQVDGQVSFVLETENATINIEDLDTEFVNCQSEVVTCVVVLKGAIAVEAQGQVVTVESGEATYMLRDEPPRPPICADLQEVEQWLDQKRGTGPIDSLASVVASWPQSPCSLITSGTRDTEPAPSPGATSSSPTAPSPAPAAPAPPLEAAFWVNPIDGAVFVPVPGEEFTMGADAGPGVSTLEQPRHTVTVESFWIQRTEVTNAQYARCVAAGACTPPANDEWDDPGRSDFPVTHVSWQQANEYAQWAGGRLPTEAEWEKACRSDDGRTYAWGDDLPTAELANFGDTVGEATPVGIYPAGASPYGVLDMGGNVWEWTSSLDYAYPYRADDGREDLAVEGRRIARGGSFYYTRYQLTCTARSGFPPGSASEYFGFRVVLAR